MLVRGELLNSITSTRESCTTPLRTSCVVVILTTLDYMPNEKIFMRMYKTSMMLNSSEQVNLVSKIA